MSRPYLRHTPGVAGVDEAGRGPLAGPVVAAVAVLPEGFRPAGLNDSKKLSPSERSRLERAIRQKAEFAIAFVDVGEIDRINILRASLLAMENAVRALGSPLESVLVDGNMLPASLPCPAKAVIDGDAKYACIAAASVLAKTARDAYMKEIAKLYPVYGFERHFGYATPEHLEALRTHGPCPIHRRSFAPCREEAQLCLTFAE